MRKIRQIENEMIRLVNNERRKKGLTKLTPSALLCGIARKHSHVQLKEQDIFHKSPVDGSDPAQRIERGGYLCKSSGENVATAPTLTLAHNGLMGSPGHYKNIIGDWNEIGIGIAEDSSGQLYVTQLFTNVVRLINTNRLLAQTLNGLFAFRKQKKLSPVTHVSIGALERMAMSSNKKIQDDLFKSALEEVQKQGVSFSLARLFQFEGYSNPSKEEQMKLASKEDLKALSLAIKQDKQTGRLKGVFLFLL